MRRVIPVALAALLLATITVPPQASGAGNGRAGVVVQHRNGTIHKDCVALPSPQISGFKLLRLSKFAFLAAKSSFGKQICWLDGKGCKTTNPDRCTDCKPADGTFDGRFWAYFTQDPGEPAPQFSSVGAGDRVVRRGSIDYWVFDDDGDPADVVPKTLRQICR